MSDIAIQVEGLGKRYRIGAREKPRGAAGLLTAPFRYLGQALRGPSEEETLWALRNVSFQVRRGEVLGIIGRNGAGKSALLKVLSRITEPTEGFAEIRGRVGSLLEVGTGFHPELTGRENVYLNGAILGMKKREIDAKFDEIAAFAEVERFLDTPVKRYSSGMYVRLAFAVAAHLDPEVLLVDEVLAVGDVAFQKKCLGKMSDVAGQGRTVLFVSHNMGAVGRLCHRAVVLAAGTVQGIGSAQNMIALYTSHGAAEKGERLWPQDSGPGDEEIRLCGIRIRGPEGRVGASLDITRPFQIELEYAVFREIPPPRIGVGLAGPDGTIVCFSADMENQASAGERRTPGRYISACTVPGNFLNQGPYSVSNCWADLPNVKVYFAETNLLDFHVEQTGGVSSRYNERWPGVTCPAFEWSLRRVASPGNASPGPAPGSDTHGQ